MKTKRFVRQSMFFLCFFTSSLMIGSASTRAEILPDIEAQQSRIVPLQKSKTGRVYRFKMDPKTLPKTGNIILVSEDLKPVMAFRVLKTEEGTGELIAKRVRRYDTTGELKIDAPYTAVEKIADLVAPPPPEPGQFDPNAAPLLDPNSKAGLAKINNQKREINPDAAPMLDPNPTASPAEKAATEVAPELGVATSTPSRADGTSDSQSTAKNNSMDVEKFDTDLDATTSPQNIAGRKAKRPESREESTDEEIPSELVEAKDGIEVEEKNIIHPFLNGISVQVGSYQNMSGLLSAKYSGATSNSGFGASYSRLINRNVFFQHSNIQDSMSCEFGFAYYSRTNFTGNLDDYSILPLRAEIRYDVHLSETFTPFVYGGLQYNFLLGSDNIDTKAHPVENAALNSLTGVQPTFGIGLLFNIGPQWYLKGDVGFDRMIIGLSVKW